MKPSEKCSLEECRKPSHPEYSHIDQTQHRRNFCSFEHQHQFIEQHKTIHPLQQELCKTM